MQKTMIYIAGIFFLATSSPIKAQVFADSETNGKNVLCSGCQIIDSPKAIDADISTHSIIHRANNDSSAYVYQDLHFSSGGSANSYVGLVVEDSILITLTPAKLSSVELTTYLGGVSNNDTKNSTQYSITQVQGSNSQYNLEFQTAQIFDAIQVKIIGGIAGASNDLKVFYSYHSLSSLPIKLLDFKAKAGKNSVDLNWITVTETNNNYFTIERGMDGKHFWPLAYIQGAGSSITNKEYYFSDTEPLHGLQYYRLKQTDNNGKFEYCKQIAVSFNPEEERLSVYPNPATENELHFVIHRENTSLRIYNLRGEQVFTKVYEGKGVFKEYLDSKIVPNGNYLIEFDYGSGKEFIKHQFMR